MFYAKTKTDQLLKNRLKGLVPHGWQAKFIDGKLYLRRLSDGFEVLAANNVKRQLTELGYVPRLGQIAEQDGLTPVCFESDRRAVWGLHEFNRRLKDCTSPAHVIALCLAIAHGDVSTL